MQKLISQPRQMYIMPDKDSRIVARFTGRSCIVALVKEEGGSDNRASRVLELTVQEQQLIKYHSSSCYKSFQRDVEKKRKNPDAVNQSETPEITSMDSSTSEH